MKNSYRVTLLIFICCSLLMSCATDDDSGATITTLTFTHYSTISFGFSNTPRLLPLSTKSGESSSFYRFVEGFEYEPGFDYELRVLEIPNDPELQDGPSNRYELLEVISKTAGSTTETFDVWLGTNFGDTSEYYTSGTALTGFQLLGSISIECGDVCDELTAIIPEDRFSLFGTFTRNDSNSYTLVSTFFN